MLFRSQCKKYSNKKGAIATRESYEWSGLLIEVSHNYQSEKQKPIVHNLASLIHQEIILPSFKKNKEGIKYEHLNDMFAEED